MDALLQLPAKYNMTGPAGFTSRIIVQPTAFAKVLKCQIATRVACKLLNQGIGLADRLESEIGHLELGHV